MNKQAAAIFIQIQNRLVSLTNINETVLNETRGELKLSFVGGTQLKLNTPEEIESFLAQVDAYILPPLAPLKVAAEPASEPEPVLTDDSQADADTGAEGGTEGEGDQGDGEPGTQDEGDEQSALEEAGLPSDLAALLHAGGLNTVEDVLTHPDLTEINDIGKGRKDKILEILQK